MPSIISDVFEQLGRVAGSAVKQAASDLTTGLVREAKKQIVGKPPNEKSPSTSVGTSQAQPVQAKKTYQNYLAQDQQMARKRISEIRNELASHNTQKITTETQKLKPPAPPKAVNNLSVSAKQGIGSGEITRGAIG